MNKGLGSLVRGAASAALSISKATAYVSLLAGTAAGAVSVLGGVGAALAAMSAALALIPAGAAAGAAAISTLVVGFQGFGDALSAADPAEFEEALKNLSPAARDTARQIRALGPAFKDLRLNVQEKLFAGMGVRIREIGTAYLPILDKGMGRVASSFNAIGQRFADFLTQAQTLKDTATLFDNTAFAINNAAPGVQFLLQAFRDIGTVASGFLPGMAAGWTTATQKFAAFIAESRKTGQLQVAIQRALDTFGDLWATIKNLGVTIVTVFGAANSYGFNFFAILRDVTGKMREFVTSSQGAKVLGQIFSGLKAIIEGLKPVLQAIGDAFVKYLAPAVEKFGPLMGQAFAKLAPAIDPLLKALGQLLPILAQIANVVAGVLTKAIQTFAPYIPKIARFFADLMEAAEPLIDALFEVASAILDAIMPVLPDLVSAFKSLVQAIAPIVEKLGPPLAKLIAALAPIIVPVIEAVAWLVEALSPLIDAIAWFIDLLGEAIGLLGDFAGWMSDAGIGATLNNFVREQGLVSGSLIRSSKSMELFGETTETESGKIGSSISILGTNFFGFASDTDRSLKKAGGSIDWLTGKTKASTAEMTARVAEAQRRIRQYWSGDLGQNSATRAFNSIELNARVKFAAMKINAYNASRGISSAFASGGWYSSGYRIGNDLASGLIASKQAAINAAYKLMASIRQFFPFSPAKKGPFSGRGYVTYSARAMIGDYTKEIYRLMPQVRRASEQINSEMSKAFPDTIGAGGFRPVINNNAYNINVEAGISDPVAVGARVKEVIKAHDDARGGYR